MAHETARNSRRISIFRKFRVATPTAVNGNRVGFSARSQRVVPATLDMLGLLGKEQTYVNRSPENQRAVHSRIDRL